MRGNAVIFDIEAESLSNLRAALNSFIKWMDMVEKIGEEMDSDC